MPIAWTKRSLAWLISIEAAFVLGAWALILILVVPPFARMYDDMNMGGDLPAITAWVIKNGLFLRDNWIVALLVPPAPPLINSCWRLFNHRETANPIRQRTPVLISGLMSVALLLGLGLIVYALYLPGFAMKGLFLLAG